jgi:hypothetical protein
MAGSGLTVPMSVFMEEIEVSTDFKVVEPRLEDD